MSSQTLEYNNKLSVTKIGTSSIIEVVKNVAPVNPAVRRLHKKLNSSKGPEATISSYDRMHHRHNRS